MAREPTPGQKAAGRAAKTRRGEMKLSQHELADLAVDVSVRTVRSFETGQRWPQTDKLVAIERALGWRAGHLADYAAREDDRLARERGQSSEVSAILASDLDEDMKRTIVAKVRAYDREQALRRAEQIQAGAADEADVVSAS